MNKRKQLAAMQGKPWVMDSASLAELEDILESGDPVDAETVAQRLGIRIRGGDSVLVGSLAVIPIVGVIEFRPSWLSDFGITVPTLRVSAAIHAALEDPQVSTIVLDIDSPGGTVEGVMELAAEIRKARDVKPIIAIANPRAASAAYWLASQASEIVVTPSGGVGSVGVYLMHVELSARIEKEGYKITFVSAGDHKVEGNPYQPLSKEAQEKFQADVDAIYDVFIADVAKGRKVSKSKVLKQFGQGRMLLAKDALAAGMVDRIAAADEVFQKLHRSKTRGRRSEEMTVREFEEALRDGESFSNAEAKRIASIVYGEVVTTEPPPRDEGEDLKALAGSLQDLLRSIPGKSQDKG